MQTIIAKISILMNDQIIHIPILNEFWHTGFDKK